MSNTDKINLIFDCDGTLIDSYPAIIDTVYRLFLKHGVDCDPEYIRRYSLRYTVDDCIEHLAGKYGLDPNELGRFNSLDEDRSKIKLFPHVREVLDNPAFDCYVYTHRPAIIHEILTNLGVHDRFIEIVESTYGFKRKPDGEGVKYLVDKYNLDRSRTYYVGDRELDVDCGIDAGVGTIYFNSSRLDLDNSKADFAVNDFIEINSLDFSSGKSGDYAAHSGD